MSSDLRTRRRKVYLLSRTATVAIVAAALGTLLIEPVGAIGWTADIVLRAWLMFLGTVMAHEATHGHLGATKRSNYWWGRLALVHNTVPYVNFRKTHWRHHSFTNVPGADPDHFIKPNATWEIPLRSLALPHYWVLWLYRKGQMKREDWIEWAATYVFLFTLYGTLGYLLGPARVFWGIVPSLVLVSFALWYSFALKTHEGWSLGAEEEQSHNYYGRLTYWLTLGLSMHRAHHMHPGKSWIELLPFVETQPDKHLLSLPFQRDVRTSS